MKCKLDLHVHTYASNDSILTIDALFDSCQTCGIDGVAICDHNTIQGALEAQQFSIESNTRIIVGEEIHTKQGELIGLFLVEEIAANLSVEETIAEIRKQGGLVYVPHPFDKLRTHVIQSKALHNMIGEIDVLEVLNAKSWTGHGDSKARNFALRHNLAMGAGSDAHSHYEVGNGRVIMRYFETPEEFKQELRKARIEGKRPSLFLRLWIKLKRLSRGK